MSSTKKLSSTEPLSTPVLSTELPSLASTPEPESTVTSRLTESLSDQSTPEPLAPTASQTTTSASLSPADHPLAMPGRQLLRRYADRAATIYNECAGVLARITNVNQQQMEKIPESDRQIDLYGDYWQQWTYARLTCLGFNLEAMNQQIGSDFLKLYQTASACLEYLDEHPTLPASDKALVNAMLTEDLGNQLLNMFSLYSAQRHDMFRALGAHESMQLNGFNVAHLTQVIDQLLARSPEPPPLFADVLSEVNAYLHEAAHQSDNPDSFHDRRPPQLNHALQTATEDVQPMTGELPHPATAKEVLTGLHDVVKGETAGYLAELSDAFRGTAFAETDYVNAAAYPDEYDGITEGLDVQCTANHTLTAARKKPTAPPVTTAMTTAATVTDSQTHLGIQSKQWLRQYANEATRIFNDFARTAQNIETLNGQQMHQLPVNDRRVDVGSSSVLQWPYARLQCLGYNLAVLKEQLEERFQEAYLYTDAYIATLKIAAEKADTAPSDITTMEALVVSDLAHQFLNMYSLYSAQRHEMFLAMGFAGEGGDSLFLQGFRVASLIEGVEQVQRGETPGWIIPTGLFSKVLGDLSDYLHGEASSSANPVSGHNSRAPHPDRALLVAIDGVAVEEWQKLGVLAMSQSPKIQKMLHHIIRTESNGYINDLKQVDHTPPPFLHSDYVAVIRQPDEYKSVTRNSGVTCSAGHTREVMQKAPVVQTSKPPSYVSTSSPSTATPERATAPTTAPTTHTPAVHPGMQSRRWLKQYANEAMRIYNNLTKVARNMATHNGQQMQQLPEKNRRVHAEGESFLQWPYARLQCLAYNLAALTEQFENSFRETYQYTDAYIYVLEAEARKTESDDLAADIATARAMVARDLTNQFLNMYSLYSATRHQMFRSTGFAGEDEDSVYLQGFNLASLAEGVSQVQRGETPGSIIPTGLFSDVLTGVSSYLGDAVARQDPVTGHVTRTPQPDKALRATIEGVTVEEWQEIPVILLSQTPDIEKMLQHITVTERDGYLAGLTNIDRAAPLLAASYESVIRYPDEYQSITRDSGVVCTAGQARKLMQQTPDDDSTPVDSLAPQTPAPTLAMQSRQWLRQYFSEATGLYNDFAKTAGNIEALNGQQMGQLTESDRRVDLGRSLLQWPYARLRCLSYNLGVMTEQLEHGFRESYLNAAAYISTIEAMTSKPESDIEAADVSTVNAMIVRNLANQFLNMYALYSTKRHEMFRSMEFAGKDIDSPYLAGFSVSALAEGVDQVQRGETPGWIIPTGLFSDVLSSLADDLKSASANKNPVTGHYVREHQHDKALQAAIDGVTVQEETGVLLETPPPEIGKMLHHITLTERNGYLSDLSGVAGGAFADADYGDVIRRPDSYQPVSSGTGVVCSAGHTRKMMHQAPADQTNPEESETGRKRRQLEPDSRRASTDDKQARAPVSSSGPSIHNKGLLSGISEGLSTLGAGFQSDVVPGITDEGSDQQSHSVGRTRVHQSSLNDSLNLANLLVSSITDRPIQRDRGIAGAFSATNDDSTVNTERLRHAPGMELLRGSMAIVKQLRSEVATYVERVNNGQLLPDTNWQADDLLNMAIACVTDDTAGCTEKFLEEVLFSPKLGVEHECANNIFDSDGRVRGGTGEHIFMGPENPVTSGPGRDLGQCMLAAMAEQQLEQLVHIRKQTTMDAQIPQALRQQIIDQASRLQEQQVKGRLQSLSSLFGRSTGSDMAELLADRLSMYTATATVPAQHPHGACIRHLGDGDYQLARESFFTLSEEQQLQAIEELRALPDCFGLEPREDRLTAEHRDDNEAWQHFTLLYDSKLGAMEEARNRLKLRSMVAGATPEETDLLTRQVISLLPVQPSASEQAQPDDSKQVPVLRKHTFDPDNIMEILANYETIKEEVTELLPSYFMESTLDPSLKDELIVQIALDSLRSLEGKPASGQQRQALIADRLEAEAEEFARSEF